MSDPGHEIQVDAPALRAAIRAGAITEGERAVLAALRRKGVDAGTLRTKTESLDTALDEMARLGWAQPMRGPCDESRVDGPALRAAVRAGAITEDERALLAVLRRKRVGAGALAKKVVSLDARRWTK